MAESTPLSTYLGILLTILLIGGFAAIVVLIIRHEKGKLDRRAQFLAGLGFQPVKTPPDHLLQRLDDIYRRHAKQRFEIRYLFEKSAPRGRQYILDLVETSGDDNTWLGNGMVCIVSPDLRLPAMRISGRPFFEGKAAEWMMGAAEKVIGWAASQAGMSQMNLDDEPEIDKKLMVLSDNEIAAGDFLTPERLRRLTWLADKDRLSEVVCAGDCFTLKRIHTQARQELEEEFRQVIEDANKVWRALE